MSRADHVNISGSIAASVTKIEPTQVTVKVTWNLECSGSSGDATFGGNLVLVDDATGEETYVGGIFAASGEESRSVSRTEHDRYVHAVGRLWCRENANTLHGSPTKEFLSNTVFIPRRAPGGGGGGGNDGGGGGGPTDPLAAGGCAVELLGTPRNDTLTGTDAAELIFALGGNDRVTAGDGHDCVIGDSGNDRLNGGPGSDRLTGSRGNDLLTGGPGRNFYDAGGGRDNVKAKNGKNETVRCGPGKDRASADPGDDLSSCETAIGG